MSGLLKQNFVYIFSASVLLLLGYYVYLQNTYQYEQLKRLHENIENNILLKIFKEYSKLEQLYNNTNNATMEIYKQVMEIRKQEIRKEVLCDNYEITKKVPIDNKKVFDDLMKDPNKVIYEYTPKDLSNPYGSHAIPLTVAALVSKGDILELGTGIFSTKILNKVAKEQNRFLLSVEMDSKWLQKFIEYNDSINHILFDHKSECAQTINPLKKWGMVFVDHLQGETRHLDMVKYANNAQIVVAHDSEKSSESYYQYSKVYSTFKYHCKYSLYVPNGVYLSTSLLSNNYDVGQLESILKNINTDLMHVACNQTYKRR